MENPKSPKPQKPSDGSNPSSPTVMKNQRSTEIDLSSSVKQSENNPKNIILEDNWNPLDDGIKLIIPSTKNNPIKINPTREDVEDYINKALYGPSTSRRRRLPVFRDICPDDDYDNGLSKDK